MYLLSDLLRTYIRTLCICNHMQTYIRTLCICNYMRTYIHTYVCTCNTMCVYFLMCTELPLEKLPKAAAAPPQELTEVEKKKLVARREATLRELRVFLRDATNKLMAERKFKEFTKPVDPDEVCVCVCVCVCVRACVCIYVYFMGNYKEYANLRILIRSCQSYILCLRT